jgi:cob(I)alamin adenosyltransferase
MSVRIYTRTGDTGETGLFGGQRVAKDHLRVETYGTVDELSCALGLARSHAQDEELSTLLIRLQHDLFTLGADLATPEAGEEHRGKVTIPRTLPALADALEREIDRLDTQLPPLTRFILPGGSPFASSLHLARAICRRAERMAVSLSHAEPINAEILRYLNRLSDLLFVMARVANQRLEVPDVIWEPGN